MHFVFNRYLSGKTIFIIASEFLLILSTAYISTLFRLGLDKTEIDIYNPNFAKIIVPTAAYIIVFFYFRLYIPDLYRPGRVMIIKLFEAILTAGIVLTSIYYLFPSLKIGRGIQFINMLLMPFVILGWRVVISRFPASGLAEQRVLIIGAGELARNIGKDIFKGTEQGFNLVGFIDDDPAKFGKSIINPGVIGGYGDIKSIVFSNKVNRIIVALKDRRAKLPMSALLDCKLCGVTIEEGETFQERMTGKIPVEHLKPSWMVFSDGFKSLRSRKIIKRASDLFFSAIGLLVLSPFLLLIAMLIKMDSKGPAIFKQLRVGENGKEFNIYKFRSMMYDAEDKTGPVWAVSNDERITRVGKVIRKLRIDEIPQLINVVKGDMSFVGPRPERPYFVEKLKEVIPYYEMRTLVKPGITGWAQIKYPYGATVHDAMEKLQYDTYYIKNMSPLLDFLIFLITIKVVFTGSGAR